jgi:hypothetical protein
MGESKAAGLLRTRTDVTLTAAMLAKKKPGPRKDRKRQALQAGSVPGEKLCHRRRRNRARRGLAAACPQREEGALRASLFALLKGSRTQSKTCE